MEGANKRNKKGNFPSLGGGVRLCNEKMSVTYAKRGKGSEWYSGPRGGNIKQLAI